MTTLRKSILVGLTVLGLSAATYSAQAEETRPGQHHAAWGERAAARHDQLHAKLQLAPAQESAWTTYLAAIKPAARPEHGARGDRAALPAPQRLEQRIVMQKQHIAMMESRLAALNTFYGILTPEQKAVFDANTVAYGGRHHGRHGGHHPRHAV